MNADSDKQNGQPEMVVAVVGDLFRETFVIPTTASAEAPFTAPEPLRGNDAVLVSEMKSGIDLHARILEERLNDPCWCSLPRTQNSDTTRSSPSGSGQTPSPVKVIGPSRLDWKLFPEYMHSLRSFPRTDRSRSNYDKVWRIASTMGIVRTSGNSGRKDSRALETERLLAHNDCLERIAKDLKEATSSTTPCILIVNDRDLGFRDAKNGINSLFKVLEPLKDLVIIWHVRKPFSEQNHFATTLARCNLRHRTLLVLNQQCLRDAGINLRFDVSYEHTFQDFLAFAEHRSPLRSSLCYPQILIRYDYGILHVGTDIDTHAPWPATPTPRIESLDAHGMFTGWFHLARHRFGMMTGRTFLLVSAIAAELCSYRRTHKASTLLDAIYMEGCVGHAKALGQTYSQASTITHPPSITKNTLIDRAIDMGVILNSMHFVKGYGPFKAGVVPLNAPDADATEIFRGLFTEFQERGRTRIEGHTSSPPATVVRPPTTAVSPPATAVEESLPLMSMEFPFYFDHTEQHLTRLTRLSAPKDVLLPKTPTEPAGALAERRNNFSRVSVLTIADVLRLALSQEDSQREQHHPVFSAENALRRIVTHGIAAVLGRDVIGQMVQEPSVVIPFVQFGDALVSLDRHEIDGFLSIQFLLESYLSRLRTDIASGAAESRRVVDSRPLSIAVFGPPGSGKSVGVKEILKGMGRGADSSVMTFNVAQFSDAGDLSRAFRRIQSRALEGDVPVAFFDEFDSSLGTQSLAWLRFFLAPMQDGKFYDGNDTFVVGPAIFIFAGGTASRFEVFVQKCKDHEQQKAPDFISRLVGHVDIKSISVQKGEEVDLAVKVRRALLLRSLLRRRLGSVFDESGEIARIDADIIDAFLEVQEFEHGARSMEAIIAMARVADGRAFDKAALPTTSQLSMHVNAKEFLDRVNNLS